MRRFLFALALLFPAVCICAPAGADAGSGPKVAVRLIPDRLGISPGGTLTLAIEQKIAPGWHTYWSNPGEAGMPTAVDWTLPKGWKAGPLQWPAPRRLPVGPLMDYGYEGAAWLLAELRAPPGARPDTKVDIAARVRWLACREVCIPEETIVRAEVFVERNAAPPDAIAAEKFSAARAELPAASPWPAVYAAGNRLRLFVAAAGLAGLARPAEAQFFPARSGLIVDSAKQELEIVPGGVTLTLTPAPGWHAGRKFDGVLALTSSDGSKQALSIHALPGAVPQTGAAQILGPWLALLFALLGGLILNVMPCVLPVLAMKVLTLTQAKQADFKRARTAAYAYGAGAIVSFVLLGLTLVALRAGGQMIGWGFQLQEPAAVALLGLLLFAVGLNLLGVFETGPIGAGEALTRKPGAAGAFFTGVLAVAVATPCTAPFMAPAIGFGLTQGPLITVGIFAALGAGFALPFCLIALFPALYRFLPRPGPWMIRLRQWLSLPMFAAAVWLVWVLARQVSPLATLTTCGAFVLMGTALWAYGASRMTQWRRQGAALAAAGIAVSLGLAVTLRPSARAPADAQPYTHARLEALRRQNRPVFVDAYASWCITCLVNEEAALNRPAVRAAFARKGIVVLKADWTRRDPQITMLLEANGRSGVPLYLYYAPGQSAPAVLPQILTEAETLKIAQ